MGELFQKYSEAFDSFDPEAIVSLYKLPCATLDGDGVNVFSSKERLIEKFEKNCEAMKAMGYQGSEFNVHHTQNLGENAKAITLGWRIHLEKDKMEFRTHYICHKENNQWFVFSANVYEGGF